MCVNAQGVCVCVCVCLMGASFWLRVLSNFLTKPEIAYKVLQYCGLVMLEERSL